jgi:hypothetical protein
LRKTQHKTAGGTKRRTGRFGLNGPTSTAFEQDGVIYEQGGVKVVAFTVDHGPAIKPGCPRAVTVSDIAGWPGRVDFKFSAEFFLLASTPRRSHVDQSLQSGSDCLLAISKHPPLVYAVAQPTSVALVA